MLTHFKEIQIVKSNCRIFCVTGCTTSHQGHSFPSERRNLKQSNQFLLRKQNNDPFGPPTKCAWGCMPLQLSNHVIKLKGHTSLYVLLPYPHTHAQAKNCTVSLCPVFIFLFLSIRRSSNSLLNSDIHWLPGPLRSTSPCSRCCMHSPCASRHSTSSGKRWFLRSDELDLVARSSFYFECRERQNKQVEGKKGGGKQSKKKKKTRWK